jgi:hypothetical protein
MQEPPTGNDIDTTELEPELNEETESDDTSNKQDTDEKEKDISRKVSSSPRFLSEFIHMIQSCHLCIKGEIPPI